MKVKVSQLTTTLYNYIRSELINKGQNEFIDPDGNLIFFEQEHQFLTKILNYDSDVSVILDKLFTGTSLRLYDHDMHFKRGFTARFLNREINRQTIEAFRLQLLTTFLTNERYINTIYSNLDRFILQETESLQKNNQRNQQSANGSSTTDDRSAFANLPQNNVQLDVDSTIMTTANDNTVSRNKQRNENTSQATTTGDTTSDSKSYRLDELLKSNGLEKAIYDEFDRACFKQTW